MLSLNQVFRVLRSLLLSLTVLLVEVTAGGASATEQTKEVGSSHREKQILMVYSYSMNFAPDAQFLRALSPKLNESDLLMRIKHVELNAFLPEASDPEAIDRKCVETLREIKADRYDVIVAFGQIALDFLVRNVSLIPERTGISYCGLKTDGRELHEKHSRTTGVAGRVPVEHGLRLALRLFPETKKVILLSDWSPSGQHVCDDLRRLIPSYPELEIKIPSNRELSLSETFDLVRESGKNTVVLFYAWFNHDSTNLVSLDYIFTQLSKNEARIFALQEPMLSGGNTMGGVYSSVDKMGEQLAVQIVHFLKEGTIPDSVSVPLKTGINYQAIQSGILAREKIPSDVVIVGDPGVSANCFFYPIHVLFFLVVGFMVFFLLALLRHKNRKLSNIWQLNRDLNELQFEYRLMLNTLPLYIYVKDANDGYRYIRVNNQCTSALGLSIEEILGKTDKDLFKEDEFTAFRQADLETMKKGEVLGDLLPFTDGKGERRIGKFYRTMICFEDGRRWLLGIVLDVTDDEANKASLQETRTLWEQVIDAIPYYFFAKDSQNSFRYVLCNKAFADFVGKRVDEVVGRTDEELFDSKEEARHYNDDDNETMSQPEGISIQEFSTDSQGVKHCISMRKKVFDGPRGMRLLVGCGNDVSDLVSLIRNEKLNREILSDILTESVFSRAIDLIFSRVSNTLGVRHIELYLKNESGELKRFLETSLQEGLAVPRPCREAYEDFWVSMQDNLQKKGELCYENVGEVPELADIVCDHSKDSNLSLFGIPIFVDNTFSGVLSIFFTQKQSFREVNRPILHAIANVIALVAIREKNLGAVKCQEQQNQIVLDHVDIPIILYNQNGSIARLNNSAISMMGISAGSLDQSSYPCRQWANCELTEERCPVALAFTDGQEHLYLNYFKDRVYHTIARPIRNVMGDVVNVIRYDVDITELTRMNRSQQVISECLAILLREDDMFEAVKAALAKACQYLKSSRCYVFKFDVVAQKIYSFLEYSEDGIPTVLSHFHGEPYLVTPSWEERFKESHHLAFPDLKNTYLENGLHNYEKYILRYDVRSLYAFEIRLDGAFWGYIGILYEKEPHELTSEETSFAKSIAYCIELMLYRLRSQRRLTDMAEKAEAADKAKSTFLASVSHEIRTPLNAVLGFSELLKDNALTESARNEYLEGISNSGNALLTLVNDVLDLSKLEAGRMVFTQVKVRFSELLQETFSIFRQKCLGKGIQLISELPEDFPILLLDKLCVRQILFNLIGNAVKFTERGSIVFRATFEPKDQKTGTFSFHVIDTGIGISELDQKNLFQMFVQADALRGTETARKGSGLGLAICKRMLEKMNGDVELTSEVGKGSDFAVTIRKVEFESDHGIARVEKGNSFPKKLMVGTSKRVLLVDDIALNLNVGAAILSKLGMTPVLAASADEAWDLLEKEHFDIMLTDLWMPGMNGWELTLKVRKSGRWPHLKIAALTADIDNRDKFDMSVFDAILTKPILIQKVYDFLCAQESGNSESVPPKENETNADPS